MQGGIGCKKEEARGRANDPSLGNQSPCTLLAQSAASCVFSVARHQMSTGDFPGCTGGGSVAERFIAPTLYLGDVCEHVRGSKSHRTRQYVTIAA